MGAGWCADLSPGSKRPRLLSSPWRASRALPLHQSSARSRGACRRRQAEAQQRQWRSRLAWGPQPEQAAEIQLWLTLFPVSWQQLPDVVLLEQQIATMRQHLGGSFTSLLTAMVLDPALQLSLNGPANHRNSNENRARELLELFSLGEGHYSELDVREDARALSGWRPSPMAGASSSSPSPGSCRRSRPARRRSPAASRVCGSPIPWRWWPAACACSAVATPMPWPSACAA